MQKVFCLLNHVLTYNQILELKTKFGAETIEYPPDSIKELWGNLPTTNEIIPQTFEIIIDWLCCKNAKKSDVIILQGEAGHSFYLIDYALKKDLIPIHSVTKRIAKETIEGEIVKRFYVFEHICFRKYCYYKN